MLLNDGDFFGLVSKKGKETGYFKNVSSMGNLRTNLKE